MYFNYNIYLSLLSFKFMASFFLFILFSYRTSQLQLPLSPLLPVPLPNLPSPPDLWASISLEKREDHPLRSTKHSKIRCNKTRHIFTNCYCIHTCVCVHTYIPKYNLLTPQYCYVYECFQGWPFCIGRPIENTLLIPGLSEELLLISSLWNFYCVYHYLIKFSIMMKSFCLGATWQFSTWSVAS